MSCNSPAAVVSYAIGAVPHGCRRFGCQKRRPVGPASISRGGQTWQRLTTLLFSSLRLEGTACVLSRETSFLCLKESACSGAQAEQIWVMGNVLAVKVVCKVGGNSFAASGPETKSASLFPCPKACKKKSLAGLDQGKSI